MPHLPGYRILEELYESVNSVAFRGQRESDGLSVILKTLKEECPPARQIEKYEHEYQIVRELSTCPGIVRILGMEKVEHSLWLVVEDFGGESLKNLLKQRTRFAVDEVLQIGIKAAESLAEIHATQIIHKDINPANIIYNPVSGEIKIIDFGISTRMPRENVGFESPDQVEGTLAYISPEQTGRMNRLVDFRTDYYSLGATLYQLLTGHLPFEVEDPRQLLNCHLSEVPKPPRALCPEIPKTVSDIVMKLLSKEPERRYQSALGLKADLAECLRQLQDRQVITPFALAQLDLCEKLLIAQKLYGRDQEIQELLKGFERVRLGTREWMLIGGYSGIGKTALVQEVYKPLTRLGGTFISGQCEQLGRGKPYSAVSDAFRRLNQQLLGEKAEVVQAWRQKLLEALGPNGQVLLSILPEFEWLLGPQPAVPELYAEESQNRFLRVMVKFVEVFAKKDHPLVLFLDDLQWVDSGSLKLMQTFMGAAEIESLFLIGAYRENEVNPAHPLMLTLKEMRGERHSIAQVSLSPLGLLHVNELLQDTLRSEPGKTGLLAALLLQKSDGNPFLLNELLEALYRERLLTADMRTGQWTWDLDRIREHGITDNAALLMARKIQGLSAVTQRVLSLASCLGNQFDPEILSLFEEKPLDEILAAIYPAVGGGFVLSVGHGHQPLGIASAFDRRPRREEFRFVHDRIQQAVYSMIPEAQRQEIHLGLGKLLWTRDPGEKEEHKVFNIVTHLNLARELLAPEDKDRLAELNLLAGKKAKASAALEPALQYLNTGLALVGDQGWQRRYELTLSLHDEAAEAAGLCGEYERMESLVGVTLAHAASSLDKVRAHTALIESETARGNTRGAIQRGIVALSVLGVHLPENPGKLTLVGQLLRTKFAFLGRRPEDLLDLAEMDDRTASSAIHLMRRLAIPAFLGNPKLMAYLLFVQVRMVLSLGHTRWSSSIFASYGILLCGVLGDLDLGYRVGRLALSLVDRGNVRDQRCRVVFVFNTFQRHWKEHVRETLPAFLEAYKNGLDTGDFEYAAFCAHLIPHHGYFLGKPLAQLERDLSWAHQAISQLNQQSHLDLNKTFWQAVQNLRGESQTPGELVGQVFDRSSELSRLESTGNRTGVFSVHFLELHLNLLFRRQPEAAAAAQRVSAFLNAVPGMFGGTRCHFYMALSFLWSLSGAPRPEQQALRRKVLVTRNQMKNWARHAPMNHLHLQHLLEAEWFRAMGKPERARHHYDRAVGLLDGQHFLSDRAFAYELAGEFYQERGRSDLARSCLQEAHAAYGKWGAQAKVRDLEQRHSLLIVR